MSNFVGLNTALTGLRASQVGLDTASHNVANANSAGYTRQRVDLRSASPYNSPVGPLGTGVTVSGIGRIRDEFLDARVRSSFAQSGWHDTSARLLGRTEAMLSEPDSGVSGALGDLWGAFEDLALDPSGGAPRRQAIGALESLSGRVRAIASGWDDLERDTVVRLDAGLREVNDLLGRVAQLNREIPQQTQGTAEPSDLLDERDRHLDRLAELVGATSARASDGTTTVSVGGAALVTGWTATPVTLVGGQLTAVDAEGGTPFQATGEVGALVRYVGVTLPGQRANLDTFVEGLVGALNDRHAAGFDANGTPGGPLFEFDPVAGAAASLRVAVAISSDPSRLAAATAAGAEHDGGNAARLADLRRDAVIGGSTAEQAYSGFVVELASAVASARRASGAQDSLTVAATLARQGMHGVSLDEEMADVVRFQRSLEAMSRVMSAIDAALDTLVNRTGVVGR